MNLFEIFINNVKAGNLFGVKNCFHPSFLEMVADDVHFWQPIHFSCRYGNLEIVKFFVENNCDIECETISDWRPIHFACRNGYLDIVEYLCQCNCELDCKTDNGYTPMDMARDYGHWMCENFLKGVLRSRLSNIFDCVRRNDVQGLDAVYSSAIYTMQEYEFGPSVLEVAVQSNASKIIDYLLNKKINVKEISILKKYIEDCSHPDAIRLIQECILYRSIRFHDADGFDLVCSAETINEHGPLVKSSFVEIAAEFGCKAFIDVLLKKSIYNEEEWTKVKDLAIVKKHLGIAEAISDRQRLLRKRADNHFTWLHSAVCDNDPDMVKYILERQLVNPDTNNEVVGTGLSLAHIMYYEKCIEMLENFNVDVNTQNKYSQSPLHEAIDSGMTDHSSYLISGAKDIDIPGFMGFTGLQCAVIKGCKEICDELVKNGANCVRYVEILQQSSLKKTVLPISKSENAVTLCMKTHQTIYPCFLEKLDGDMVKSCDGDKNSLLHMAVKTLQPDLCNTLIKSGSNVEAINDQGNSPLFELFSLVDNHHDNVEKAIAILDILIDSGVDVNTVLKSGITIFQVASQWNSERLMLSLLLKQSQETCVTETDFKLIFTNQWFKCAAILINLIPEESLQSVITNEIFNLAMPHCDPKLLMSLFMKSTPVIQQLVIEDLLYHFALIDKYDEFLSVLNIEILKPKLFANGETLFTSLLKKIKLKFCWAIINCETNKKCIFLVNSSKETPLLISIETDLFDLIIPLIINCDDQLDITFNWHDSLVPLFQKLSNSNNNDMDHKLLAAIKAIICSGGNIYKKTPEGTVIINYCTRFKERIEAFHNKGSRNECGYKKICNICNEKEVDCVLDCGHMFCMDCAEQLYRCSICSSEVTKLIKLCFN